MAHVNIIFVFAFISCSYTNAFDSLRSFSFYKLLNLPKFTGYSRIAAVETTPSKESSPASVPSSSPAGDPSTSPAGDPSPSPAGDPSPSPAGDPSPSPKRASSPPPAAAPFPSPAGYPSPSPNGAPSPPPRKEDPEGGPAPASSREGGPAPASSADPGPGGGCSNEAPLPENCVSCRCPRMMDCKCGSDGRNYSNLCLLECAKTNCPDQTTELDITNYKDGPCGSP